MEKYFIRVAEQSDANEIFDFKLRHYNKDDPLEMAHPDNNEETRDISIITEGIESKFVWLAVERSSDKLVGILLAGPMNQNFADGIKEFAAQPGDQKRSDIMNFIIYIEQKANILQRFNVEEAFYIQVVAVHQDHRRQQIARKLFETAIDSAKSNKFKLLCVDCTSFYSAKLAANLGMDCISTVTYDEYNNHLGRNLFAPVEPHMEIKSFVKKL